MRRTFLRRCALGAASLALLAGCSQGVSQNSNDVIPDPQQLAAYRTYALDRSDRIDAFVSRAPDLPGRLRATLEEALQERGLVPDALQPDLLVSVAVGVTHRGGDLMSWYGINSRTGLLERDLALEDGTLQFALRLVDARSEKQVALVSLMRSGRLEQQDNGRLRSVVRSLLQRLGW